MDCLAKMCMTSKTMLRLISSNLHYIKAGIELPSYVLTLGRPRVIPNDRTFLLPSGQEKEVAKFLQRKISRKYRLSLTFACSDGVESSAVFMERFAKRKLGRRLFSLRFIGEATPSITTFTEDRMEYESWPEMPRTRITTHGKPLAKLNLSVSEDRRTRRELHATVMVSCNSDDLYALIRKKGFAYFDIAEKQGYLEEATTFYNVLMEEDLRFPNVKKTFPIPREHPILDVLSKHFPNLEIVSTV